MSNPMQQVMARWPDKKQELGQADLSSLYSPPPGNTEALTGAMQQASQLAPNGIPWRDWRRSENVEDNRNPQQGGVDLLKKWFETLQMMQLLQNLAKSK